MFNRIRQNPVPAPRPTTWLADLISRARSSRSPLRYLVFAMSALVSLSVLAAALPALLGLDTFVLNGGSMEPSLRAGALVVARRVDPGSIRVGDIVTFRHTEAPDTPVTHRVTHVLREQDGSVQLLTKGDANATADPEPVSGELPISRMLYTVPYAGYVITSVRTPAGQALFIGLPVALLLGSLLLSRRTNTGPIETVPPPPRLAVPRPTTSVEQPSRASNTANRIPRIGFQLSALMPRPRPAPPATPPSTSPSPLRRLSRLRTTPGVRLDQVSQLLNGIETGAGPLLELVDEQTRLEARFAANLHQALLPLSQYAEQREADLKTLVMRASWEGTASPPDAVDVQEEKRRIQSIRAEIARQEQLLRADFDAEREAVDAALAVFDAQVQALEDHLSAARRTADRISEGLRAEPFTGSLNRLRARIEQVSALAASGASSIGATPPASAITGDGAAAQPAHHDWHTVFDVSSETPSGLTLLTYEAPGTERDNGAHEPRSSAPAA